jgi:hypothetical protein
MDTTSLSSSSDAWDSELADEKLILWLEFMRNEKQKKKKTEMTGDWQWYSSTYIENMYVEFVGWTKIARHDTICSRGCLCDKIL